MDLEFCCFRVCFRLIVTSLTVLSSHIHVVCEPESSKFLISKARSCSIDSELDLAIVDSEHV